MSIYSTRFTELEQEMEAIGSTYKKQNSEFTGSYESVDQDALLAWRIKVINLIAKISGKESEHYEAFKENEIDRPYSDSFTKYKNLKAVFSATKEDYEGGYLSSYKSIIQAEVFDTELEQAYELLKNGYHVAAAVIGGVVLETTLRELCDRLSLPHGKMDKMNADLAKSGAYNKIVQKQITAHAGIRNSAAHGNDDFTKKDVEQMLPAIESFLASQLSS